MLLASVSNSCQNFQPVNRSNFLAWLRNLLHILPCHCLPPLLAAASAGLPDLFPNASVVVVVLRPTPQIVLGSRFCSCLPACQPAELSCFSSSRCCRCLNMRWGEGGRGSSRRGIRGAMEGERGRMEWNGGLREEGEEGEEREETALPGQPPTAVPGLRLRVREGGEGW